MENQNNEDIRLYFSMIQDIIKRMAQNSFMLKGWSLTIFAAIVAFNLENLQWILFLNAFVIIGFFWILDSYYLRQERLFRSLWEKNIKLFNSKLEELKKGLFNMDTGIIQSALLKKDRVSNVPRIMISLTEGLFYIPLELISILFFVLLV